MSLHPTDATSIPAETQRVARAAFPKGTLAMHLRDTLGNVFTDPMFAQLFPRRGQPAEAPWRLAGIVKLSQGVQKVTLEVGGISPSQALFLSAVGGKAAVKPTTPHESGIRWES